MNEENFDGCDDGGALDDDGERVAVERRCEHPSLQCTEKFVYRPGVSEKFCAKHTCELAWCFQATTRGERRHCPEHICARCELNMNHAAFAQHLDLTKQRRQASAARRRVQNDLRVRRWCNVCTVRIEAGKSTPFPDDHVPSYT